MMSPYNALSQAQALLLLEAASYDETADPGTEIDVLDYEGVGLFVLNAALGTGTTPTLNVTLEHSDLSGEGEDFDAVAGGAFGQVTGMAGDGIQVIQLNTSNLKRYVRAVATIAGTTPDFTLGMEFVGLKKAS